MVCENVLYKQQNYLQIELFVYTFVATDPARFP